MTHKAITHSISPPAMPSSNRGSKGSKLFASASGSGSLLPGVQITWGGTMLKILIDIIVPGVSLSGHIENFLHVE